MTQFTLSMLLKIEGAPAAKAAIQDVAKATDALGTATKREAEAERAAAGARRTSARATDDLAAANVNAAGAVAQAGRSAEGSGGRFSALGGILSRVGSAAGGAVATGFRALLGTFNPIPLAIGLITGAAIEAQTALIEWLTSSSNESEKLRSALEAIRAASADTQTEIDKLRFGVDEEYQVQLLQEQIRLRAEYNAKFNEAQRVASMMGDDERARAQYIADANAELQVIADKYNEISAALSEQQNRSAQLAILKGIEAQKAGELAAKQEEASRAAAALQGKIAAVVSSLNSADGSRLVAAFQAAFPVASQLLGMAQGIIATIGAASAAASAQDKLDQMAIEFSPGGQAMMRYGSRTPGGSSEQRALEVRNRPQRIPGGVGGVGGGGGGAAAARDEADALQDLIDSLEGEIEALRVQDPIQREMLKHREALAGATEAERQKVEELIATREREALAMEAAKARADFFNDLGSNALDALITKGESFNDVLKNIANSLIEAALQALIFGEGPFGSLFGGTSIMQAIFPALGAGKAGGGQVHGPGDGTKDTFLTPTANGEYIVNARATARHLPLLEAINSGAQITAGRATGGMVGSGTRRMGGRGFGSGPSTLVVDVRGAQGNTEVREMVRRGVQIGLQLYDREALPRSVRRVSADSKRVN